MQQATNAVSHTLTHALFPVTPAQLAHRARIAQTVSPLKRIKPRVPFWELAAHRVPTLWGLYRGLLRAAGDEQIRWRIRCVFEEKKGQTSPEKVKSLLLKGYRWLEKFQRARNGDEHMQRVMERYSRLIWEKRQRVRFIGMMKEDMIWRLKLRTRPILTGGYMRPTHTNPPLPHMKPQPLHISCMIRWRRQAFERRFERRTELYGWHHDMRMEAQFERNLLRWNKRIDDKVYKPRFTPVFDNPEWTDGVQEDIDRIQRTFQAAEIRRSQPFPQAMIDQVERAKYIRLRNHAIERIREIRGEVTNKTLKRRRQRPPTWVEEMMTPKQRKMDVVSRQSVSQVGYMGMVKQKLGHNVKKVPDGEKGEMIPLWLVYERGERKNAKWLKRTTRKIRLANLRKRLREENAEEELSKGEPSTSSV
ncbi:hypothetical protein K474DRAFT_1602040 [Panus rudis PR-1116 ss-1]|nr:hypothetical protein K474DRAFT_1602040 [Panus rudis PR-1116 ss-1]